MNFRTTNEFEKDFKKLFKKFRSLKSDLLEFKKIVNKFPLGIGKHFIILTKTEGITIIKARFFCKSLKGKNLRIIYAFYRQEGKVEFVEVYFKGKKEREDKKRIEKCLRNE